ncbi:hypothetical protein CJ030_MR7G018894 [Morella rubra]|uniref:Uncharacterized protein n=1 Tax=Morella rubra TaxID=262757 RepID=A0A6A1V147_9ROSI|nr:hypothetical protein CJ030_MR7G018899 [Morella rubra]KAB1206375.1 hypothetical protein CJ030_MR7G018894 [Morella rubra]
MLVGLLVFFFFFAGDFQAAPGGFHALSKSTRLMVALSTLRSTKPILSGRHKAARVDPHDPCTGRGFDSRKFLATRGCPSVSHNLLFSSGMASVAPALPFPLWISYAIHAPTPSPPPPIPFWPESPRTFPWPILCLCIVGWLKYFPIGSSEPVYGMWKKAVGIVEELREMRMSLDTFGKYGELDKALEMLGIYRRRLSCSPTLVTAGLDGHCNLPIPMVRGSSWDGAGLHIGAGMELGGWVGAGQRLCEEEDTLVLNKIAGHLLEWVGSN